MAKRNEKDTESMEDTKSIEDMESTNNQTSAQEQPVSYVITCRNQISKKIGGVDFIKGVGHTGDGFTASWFANKEGYEVKKNT